MANKEIKITNGVVFVKEFIPHGLNIAYKKALFQDTFSDQDNKGSMPVINSELASEILVLGMIEKVIINDVETQPTIDWLNLLNESDYRKIELHCLTLKKELVSNEKK